MLSDRHSRASPGLVLFFQLPEPFAEAGLLSVHGPKLFQHAALRVVEALHNRSQNVHVVAQARHFGGQPLQRPTDVGQIDNRLASLVAQCGISLSNYARYRDRPANCERCAAMNELALRARGGWPHAGSEVTMKRRPSAARAASSCSRRTTW